MAEAGSRAAHAHYADGRLIPWSPDGGRYEAARRLLAEELIRALEGDRPPQPNTYLEQSIAWKSFLAASDRLELLVDGTRIRWPTDRGSRDVREVEVECTLSLRNRSRFAWDGTVKLGPLDEENGKDEGDEEVEETFDRGAVRVPSHEHRKVTLRSKSSSIRTEAGGFRRLPIEFRCGRGEPHRVETRLSLVTALRPTVPIRTDGDLSDWPPGTVNVAGAFTLITGIEAHSPGDPVSKVIHLEASVKPRAPTWAFVLRDATHLHVAVNCEGGEPVTAGSPCRKQVAYEDLIPLGEELIEVLIDPLNAGTRTPEELYHIVVKRCGSYLAERGVSLRPPVGRTAPWAVDLAVATRENADRWTVEMSIPLDAFDDASDRDALWGFNVTRFDARHQEFSTWSGAVGNAYDPLSLGNLYLPVFIP
jgi:hypothetical protein